MTADSSYFLDSNVWIYALSDDNGSKANAARALVDDLGDRIHFSTQVVNETCLNLKRKSSITESEIRKLLRSFFLNYKHVELTEADLAKASNLRERHAFSFWDSLIAVAAISAKADILFSEDMQDGFVLENKIKIVNPFNN